VGRIPALLDPELFFALVLRYRKPGPVAGLIWEAQNFLQVRTRLIAFGPACLGMVDGILQEPLVPASPSANLLDPRNVCIASGKKTACVRSVPNLGTLQTLVTLRMVLIGNVSRL
jgi:hypothetical protein